MRNARTNRSLFRHPSVAALSTCSLIAVFALAGGGCRRHDLDWPRFAPLLCEDFGGGIDLKLTGAADVFRDGQRLPSLAELESRFRVYRRNTEILHPSDPTLAVTVHASPALPAAAWAAPVVAMHAGGAERLHPVALRPKGGGDAAGGHPSTAGHKCSIHVVLREDPEAVALSDLSDWQALASLAGRRPGARVDPSR